MFIHTKIALSAFMISLATSAAMANDLETTGREQTANASSCPWLEGYPDCQPDVVHQPDIEPARQHPITGPSRHQRTPKYRRQSAAPASRTYGPASTTEESPAQA